MGRGGGKKDSKKSKKPNKQNKGREEYTQRRKQRHNPGGERMGGKTTHTHTKPEWQSGKE